MSAKIEDRPRLALEDALGCLCDAEERLRCVALRVTSRMRTQTEADEVTEINAARASLRRVQSYISRCHPQGWHDEESAA